MDVLNSRSLLDAIEMCDSCSDMKIGILFENQWSLDEFAQTFRDEIQHRNMKGWVTPGLYLRTYQIIISPNGSTISLINCRDPSKLKSKRFDWVLYENGVNEDLLKAIVEIEFIPSSSSTVQIDSELDDFLKGFKIIPCSVKPL